MWFWSANFEGSRVTYGSEDSGDLSLRDACLGRPRQHKQNIFHPKQCWFRCKGDNGKGMKGGHKEGTHKTKGKGNFIDPSLQDNVVIQSGFFQHVYHIGCAFNLQSIINNGLIPGGQNSSKRQTVFFCLFIPEMNGTKILKRLTWMYHVMHNICIAHGRNIKTRFVGLILILQFGKD